MKMHLIREHDKNLIATDEYSTNWRGGSHMEAEFKEKPVKVKPFCVYPYSLYDKYGGYVKQVSINPSFIPMSLPRFN